MTQSTLRVVALAEERYLSQAQPSELLRALRRAGHEVTVVDPSAAAYNLDEPRWLDCVDAVVARGRSRELLYLLTWAETRGVRTINRRAAIAGVLNKAHMQIALTGAGLPTPRSFLGPVARLAAVVPADGYPLIVKPMFGDNAQGLRIVEDAEALGRLEWPETTAVVQQFFGGRSDDLKIYVIGPEIWAVRKPSPIHSGPRGVRPPTLVPVTALHRTLARRCAALFGLHLFGIDCLEIGGDLLVIEVNDFPNYTGVPAAGERLAEYVVAEATRRKDNTYADWIRDGASSADAQKPDLSGGVAAPDAVGRKNRRHLPRRPADGSQEGDGGLRPVRAEIGD